MAQRFVIDININTDGKTKQGGGEDSTANKTLTNKKIKGGVEDDFAKLKSGPSSVTTPKLGLVGKSALALKEAAPQLKALGVATAWKVANTAIDLKNYTSGDSYANAKRSNNMKLASYGAALVGGSLSGTLPLMVTAIAINEGVSAFTGVQKYNYDRKLERTEITNIIQIAGDISYGRNRGGK